MRDDPDVTLRRRPLACRFGCAPEAASDDEAGADLAHPPAASAMRSLRAAAPLPPYARKVPQLLMTADPGWRRACLAASAHIPSGYTYLGQLMGHDMGSSVQLSAVPHVQRGNVIGAVSVLGPQRYNLIDNPLTLETIYGPGPMMLTHLYDPDTMLFRISPGARLARVYQAGADATDAGRRNLFRALYDERNRDTLMLHELAVAWMQFHNLCARQLLAGGETPFRAYVVVRNHAVRVWHGIVRDDILPRFLHPLIAAQDDLPDAWRLDEKTLLHGLFRAFHAMPLAAYDLGRTGVHNLRSLLKTGFDHSEAETDWSVDWALFFGERTGGPRTGLSASIAPELRAPVTAAAVIALDSNSTGEAQPLRPGNPLMQAALAALPDPWPARLSPQALVADFAAGFPAAPVAIEAEGISWGPLFQMLLIEAQLHGQNGGFGPFGSALLKGSILGSIDRVQTACRTSASGLPRPKTMLELIKLVRGN